MNLFMIFRFVLLLCTLTEQPLKNPAPKAPKDRYFRIAPIHQQNIKILIQPENKSVHQSQLNIRIILIYKLPKRKKEMSRGNYLLKQLANDKAHNSRGNKKKSLPDKQPKTPAKVPTTIVLPLLTQQ